ncbi:MAG: hypothetical protein NWF07_06250 [Candidatus Bathyarchaeota archaeon]|nr:hypothetical protein [Candidatus Bathyarchaeota archaeon]
MENLEKLFFELASENRLTILHILTNESLKMQEIANRLDITATEVFRQLQRLTEVSLVERLPDGSFTITMYGRLVLHLSSSYDFISRHREYFLEHDIWSIPEPFINRLGELEETKLLNTVMSFNKSISIFLEAEEYAWGLSERGEGPDSIEPLVDKRIEEGIPFKLMVPESFLPDALAQNPSKSIEIRGFTECPAVIVLNEKEAMIFFKFKGGPIDYTGFYGTDPVFMNWARELFTYYWDRGTHS